MPSWPSQDQWIPWPEMWATNENGLGQNCAHAPAQPSPLPNSQEETQVVREAIEYYAATASVDPRLIFALVLSESQGCVRAASTTGDVWNPGLMQSYEGPGDCYVNGTQSVPCPRQMIFQMIFDGVQGAGVDTVVKMILQRQLSGSPKAYYEAIRLYNSGPNFVIPPDLSSNIDATGLQSGTANYVSKAVNLLLGWNDR